MSAGQIRCAVQVPEHNAPRQVPDPEVPVRRPEPTARFIPLINVTRMLPASATRPDAVIIALLEATRPLLIPIETLDPPPQAELVEAIWTFQAPSKLAAAAGVVMDAPASNRMRVAMIVLRRLGMTFPFVPMQTRSHVGVLQTVTVITLAITRGRLMWITSDPASAAKSKRPRR